MKNPMLLFALFFQAAIVRSQEFMTLRLSDRGKGIYMIHLNTGHNNLIKKLILK